MEVYPGDPAPRFSALDSPTETSSITTTWVEFNSHTGTHVDAPAHFFPNKAPIDQISLSLMIGDAIVVSFNNPEHLSTDYYEAFQPLSDKIVLLKTVEDKLQEPEFLGLSHELVQFFIRQGIKAIGIDTLSIDRVDQSNLVTHRLLLEAQIPIIEGLNLTQVPLGDYFCVCLPLKLKGLDGAPARCVLIRF